VFYTNAEEYAILYILLVFFVLSLSKNQT